MHRLTGTVTGTRIYLYKQCCNRSQSCLRNRRGTAELKEIVCTGKYLYGSNRRNRGGDNRYRCADRIGLFDKRNGNNKRIAIAIEPCRGNMQLVIIVRMITDRIAVIGHKVVPEKLGSNAEGEQHQQYCS